MSQKSLTLLKADARQSTGNHSHSINRKSLYTIIEQDKVSKNDRLFKKVQDPAVLRDKRKVIIAVLFSMTFLQTLYMNLATFFPTYAEDNYPWVDEFKVAIILSMF